jgi:alkyldihydroxyacetonephosphate synthase
MRWWGWGDPNHLSALDEHILGHLRATVGVSDRPRPPVALAAVRLAPCRVHRRALDALALILPAGGVRTDHLARVLHAAGKGYPDLLRLRAGEPQLSPDAVLYPSSEDQLRSILALCERESIAVVPFGGGTSVVGGLTPLSGEHAAVAALDLTGLGQITRIDRQSLMITAQAGMRAVELERQLAPEGLTLGHFPQSFEYVSLGGCAATRSAGQASTGYGPFEDMVLGLGMITPTGNLNLAGYPASAAGPDLRELILGSEGTLGVICELELRVRHAPQQQLYEAVLFEDFPAGCQALRELAQEHTAPTVLRLSDLQETRLSMVLAGGGALKSALTGIYLGARGHRDGALAILGFAGSEVQVDVQRKRVLELVRRHGALALGGKPGRAWARQRFSGPYLRDDLLTHGVMVETFETATKWSNLARAHRNISESVRLALGHPQSPVLVLCHVSHVYETGASLYFTVITRQREGAELEQWQTLKQAAAEAMIDSGATITHHHAVGTDHARWMGDEIGQRGVDTLRALKVELDPAGIMNPGKLLP